MSTIKDEPKFDPSLFDMEADVKQQDGTGSLAATDGRKRKADASAGGAAVVDTKRTKTDKPAGPSTPRQDSQKPKSKCAAFWYEDGNVVIVVEETAFKLYKARLSKFSTYFEAMFANDAEQNRPTMEGCPVYRAEGVAVSDFKQFLEALETPFVFVSKPPSQDTAIAILRASQQLGCQTTRSFAVERLRAIWPNDKPRLPGGSRAFEDAIKIMQVSRDCQVPQLRKRAFYELVRSAPFWTTLRENRQAVGLPDSDIVALLSARAELQNLFMVLILEPPQGREAECPGLQAAKQGGDPKTAKLCAPRIQKGWGRKANWVMNMYENGDLMVGKTDPLGHLQNLLTERLKVVANAGWCSSCLQERVKAWQDAQGKWWGMLDDWLKT
ncbi:hypothetical protein OH76DRAFT_1554335 [Lentinus brumalis]|uniref:BTB domain-containing protein n=1 Tax=Lentinus brumalis TaxID=2498619 RepID=A0A371DHZ5_9APHY|nr:hypothetical protein OH76DRAFT_1554335 [Polyporus brumalis]